MLRRRAILGITIFDLSKVLPGESRAVWLAGGVALRAGEAARLEGTIEPVTLGRRDGVSFEVLVDAPAGDASVSLGSLTLAAHGEAAPIAAVASTPLADHAVGPLAVRLMTRRYGQAPPAACKVIVSLDLVVPQPKEG